MWIFFTPIICSLLRTVIMQNHTNAPCTSYNAQCSMLNECAILFAYKPQSSDLFFYSFIRINSEQIHVSLFIFQCAAYECFIISCAHCAGLCVCARERQRNDGKHLNANKFFVFTKVIHWFNGAQYREHHWQHLLLEMGIMVKSNAILGNWNSRVR